MNLKSLIKRIFIDLLVFIRIDSIFRFINRKKILFLMYHGITSDQMEDMCWWQLPKNQFIIQLNHIKENFNVIKLSELIFKINNNISLSNNLVVLTFDDGYENNFNVACPILRRFNFPATIFLPTNLIEKDQLIWVDELWIIFCETNSQVLDLTEFNFKLFNLDSKNKMIVFDEVCEWLKVQLFENKQLILSSIKDQLSKDQLSESLKSIFKLMSWQQVKQLNNEKLFTFGAHTSNHEILSKLDDEMHRDEIINSCTKIKEFEEHLVFAYPNGRSNDYDDRSKKLLDKLDVKLAFSTISGLNENLNSKYDIKRIGIGANLSINEFKLLCSGLI